MPLNDDECQAVRQVLTMAGWRQVMEPRIAKKAHESIRALILRPAERTGEYEGMDDISIRERIAVYEWMLVVWENEVRMNDLERSQRNELARQHGVVADGEGAETDNPLANPSGNEGWT
jgi:hypothetical protein